MRPMRVTMPGLVIAFVGLCPAIARSQTADEHIARGVALRQRGDDEAALAELRQAYDMGHGARAQGQVALAEQALGHWADAERDLTAALASASDPWGARNRVVLETS